MASLALAGGDHRGCPVCPGLGGKWWGRVCSEHSGQTPVVLQKLFLLEGSNKLPGGHGGSREDETKGPRHPGRLSRLG